MKKLDLLRSFKENALVYNASIIPMEALIMESKKFIYEKRKEGYSFVAIAKMVGKSAEAYRVAYNYYEKRKDSDLFQALLKECENVRAGQIYNHLRKSGIYTLEDVREVFETGEIMEVYDIGKEKRAILAKIQNDEK